MREDTPVCIVETSVRINRHLWTVSTRPQIRKHEKQSIDEHRYSIQSNEGPVLRGIHSTFEGVMTQGGASKTFCFYLSFLSFFFCKAYAARRRRWTLARLFRNLETLGTCHRHVWFITKDRPFSTSSKCIQEVVRASSNLRCYH